MVWKHIWDKTGVDEFRCKHGMCVSLILRITSHFAYQQNKNYEHIHPFICTACKLNYCPLNLFVNHMRHRSYWCIHLSPRFLSFIHFHLWKSHYFHKSSFSTVDATHSLNMSVCSSVVVLVHIHFIICIHFVCAHEKLRTKNILKEGSKNLFFENRERMRAPRKNANNSSTTQNIYTTLTTWLALMNRISPSVRHINAQRLYAGRNPIDHNMIVEMNERKKNNLNIQPHVIRQRKRVRDRDTLHAKWCFVFGLWNFRKFRVFDWCMETHSLN